MFKDFPKQVSNEVGKDHPVQIVKEECKDFQKQVCNEVGNNHSTQVATEDYEISLNKSVLR